uniref:Amiloride-sensitive sodium channel n=1 Tax=Steinernema glaseri TaxID=37863 RepID=A0A1I7ZJ42_9BILA
MAVADDEEPFLSDDDLLGDDEEADDGSEERRIVLHVYDDESKEFTSLTTYHGMNIQLEHLALAHFLVPRRGHLLNALYDPRLLLYFYLSHPTFLQETIRVDDGSHFPFPTVCLRIACGLSNTCHSASNPCLVPALSSLQRECVNNVLFKNKGEGCEGVVEDLESEYWMMHNRSLSLQKLFIDSEMPSIKVVQGNFDVSHRVTSRRFLTQHGICESLNITQLFPLTSLTLILDDVQGGKTYKPKASHVEGEGFHVKPGKRSIATFKIVEEHYLEKGDRGYCRPGADIAECMDRCKARTYLNRCNCLPYYFIGMLGIAVPECSLTEIRDCLGRIKEPSHDCDCLVGCRRTNYRIRTTTYSRLPPKLRNSTLITLRQDNHLITEYRQLKRFKTVDLLSFVAGSMGLFLGMSCITLMEIFMYLFKSLWGMVNNSRHKEFLEKLLGESVDNPVDESESKKLKLSHEQIAITVKGCNDNNVITVDHEALGNRRLSFIPFNRSKLDKGMYDSKWQLAVPPRLEITRSRASTLDSKFSFDQRGPAEGQ